MPKPEMRIKSGSYTFNECSGVIISIDLPNQMIHISAIAYIISKGVVAGSFFLSDMSQFQKIPDIFDIVLTSTNEYLRPLCQHIRGVRTVPPDPHYAIGQLTFTAKYITPWTYRP